MPAMSKNLTFLEHDSRVSKLNKICEGARLFNFSRNYGYITFTMDSSNPELLDECFEKIKKIYDAEWEEEKKNSIFYLKKSVHSLSQYAYFLSSHARNFFLERGSFKEISSCENFWEIGNSMMSIKKIYVDFCGNYNPLVLIDNKSVSNYDVPLKLSPELVRKLNDDLIKRGYKTHIVKNNEILFPVYLKDSSDLNIFFAEENFNKEILTINEFLIDKEYLDKMIYTGSYKSIGDAVVRPNLNYLDYSFAYYTRIRSSIDVKDQKIFLSTLTKQLYNFHQKAYDNIAENKETFIQKYFFKTKAAKFVPEDFKNSYLTYAKTENYNLTNYKRFNSFWSFFGAMMSSLFIIFFIKLNLKFFKSKLHD